MMKRHKINNIDEAPIVPVPPKLDVPVQESLQPFHRPPSSPLPRVDNWPATSSDSLTCDVSGVGRLARAASGHDHAVGEEELGAAGHLSHRQVGRHRVGAADEGRRG